jgi:ABC-2 type transport system ATP-binding protein
VIDLKDLQKVTDGRTVIDIPDFRVEAGQVVALIGPTGSGKSTLLSLFIGSITPSMGTINIAGENPAINKRILSQMVGVLFADDGLYQHRSVGSNMEFQCKLYGLPKTKAQEMLARVGLVDHKDVRADRLTTGLARRLAFGRTIIHDPKVLLLVEPFDRCDETSISIISGLIRESADNDVAILILANDIAYLQTLCDLICELENGRIAETYRPTEVRKAELPFKVPVRLEGKVVLINPVDILFADVQEGRAFLHTVNGRLPTQFTLAELETRLERSGFFRAHRAYLVNLQHIKEVIPYTRNSFSLRLDDADSTEIPLSKSAAAELKSLLDY